MKNDLIERTFNFSNDIIDLVEELPQTYVTRVIINQIVKSGTSVGANYRAAQRARSDKEFIAKMNIVLEETDETLFWLEIIKYKNWIADDLINKMMRDADELTAIFVTILKNINNKNKK